MKKICLVAGARPNFMKIAPVLRAIRNHPDTLQPLLVHTGQHYDDSMSAGFFRDLGISAPDYNLEAGSGSHAVQTAGIMMKFEEVCLKQRPDLVMVVGDVNSTIAAGLVAKKLHLRLAHIEAGLRSRDRSMPEEINRIATDAITDLFFTTEKDGTANLLAEGHDPESVHFVGHVMIDNLFYQLEKQKGAAPSPLAGSLKKRLPGPYFCLTLHRPSNVDDRETLERITGALAELAARAPVLFPCHPRTRKQIGLFGLADRFTDLTAGDAPLAPGIHLTAPLGYDDFLYLWKNCTAMLTDSGGLQEETTALKVPCITMRETTERPITADVGSNVVVGTDPEQIVSYGADALNGKWKESRIPDLWDGKASERIVAVILRDSSEVRR